MAKKYWSDKINIIFACVLLAGMFLLPVMGMAEPDDVPYPPETEQKTYEYARLRKSITETIVAEKENLRQLEERLNQAQQLEKTVATDLNAYKIQLSSNGSLLLMPGVQIKELEEAWSTHQASLYKIENRLKELIQKRDDINQLLRQADEQYSLNKEQLFDINTESSDPVETQALVENLQHLTRLLAKKIQHLEKIHEIYQTYVSQLEETRKAFIKLSEEFDQRIKTRETEALFKRKDNPLILLTRKQLGDETEILLNQMRMLISKNFWVREFQMFRNSGMFLLVSCVMVFGMIQIMLFRLQRYCFRLEQEEERFRNYPWRHLVLQLFHRSLLLKGTILFIFTYAHLQNIYTSVPLIRLAFQILLILLFTRWCSDFMKLWNQQWERYDIPAPVIFQLKVLLNLIRVFAISYVVMEWMLGMVSGILFFVRLAFEIVLFIWCIRFWRVFRTHVLNNRELPILPNKFLASVRALTYILVIGGLILEISGYGTLALYWYTSWGASAVVVLWGSLSFLVIREWNKSFKRSQASAMADTEKKPADTIQWLLIQISWLVWFAVFSVLVFFAWGASQAVIGFSRFLNTSFSLGSMNLSFMRFVYALLVLLFTHAATRLWQHTLLEKFLAYSGLGAGAKESIKTITVYLFWIFGILISLNMGGVSATSMTVAFGALGIGLGFGLQNIFNNFISGIILLFERPIQVGDAVEINGIWGEVRKINVRSTLVQTYDNASLIIPNSEFISNQLKNWTFKDPRVRRAITVGVAYGSDVKLVKQTLLEIAGSIPEVFKYPVPQVLFSDFGDSALVFNLRFWSHVDVFLAVETAIRFEIDRLFREKNIEIAFPQQDIHIRSIDQHLEQHTDQQLLGKQLSADIKKESKP